MKKHWATKFFKKDDIITNDELAVLEQRLKFFVPKLFEMLKPAQWILYIIFWAVFVTILAKDALPDWQAFCVRFFSELLFTSLAVFPSLLMVEFWRPNLQHLSTLRVCVYICVLVCVNSFFAQAVALFFESIYHPALSMQSFLLACLISSVMAGGFALLFLLYFFHQHRQFWVLRQEFEKQLVAQNDLIKARLTPHSFFNGMNTLMSLIETNPVIATEFLQRVSTLFHASFEDVKEISLEEEIILCEHYLAIEAQRLGNKLVVVWDLPDNDSLYDVVIVSLTLQRVLEEILIHIVEMATETVYLKIQVVWENQVVKIFVNLDLPKNTLLIDHNLRQQMNFRIQSDRLKQQFGKSSEIHTQLDRDSLRIRIQYPLHD